MIVIMKAGTTAEELDKMANRLATMGCEPHKTQGENYCIFGLVGDTTKVDLRKIEANQHVERVLKVQHPFKLANRLFHPEDTVIDVEGVKMGGGHVAIMAGPCSVESEEQMISVARSVKAAGAHILRGGAFKPRTSPYSFQGLGETGLKILKKAKAETGLPIVTEVMSWEEFDIVEAYTDILQIGARNMQNFSLLKRAGKSSKPILLKRGLSATIEELLMSAEYIMAEGNSQVILCERGIRTFETYTRNTLDLSAIPAVKELSHLPIVVDPSHATGRWPMVHPLSKAAISVGTDGLIIEVHNDPENALCDGAQSLKPEKFAQLMIDINELINLHKKDSHLA